MTKIMGIVNVTPDSFFDGGRYARSQDAIEHGRKLLEDGADILDIGGESSRPGAQPLAPEREIARIIPVIEALSGPARDAGAELSVDTRNAMTMHAALQAGATMINDISAATHDPHSVEVLAAASCRIILMHMQGTPETMQNNPVYNNAMDDIHDWLAARIDALARAGIAKSRLLLDPGIGFGKTLEHNLLLLRGLTKFQELAPVVVGLSRKQFIARLSRDEVAKNRLGGSIAGAIFATAQGVSILRVHDVAETIQALKVWRVLQEAEF